ASPSVLSEPLAGEVPKPPAAVGAGAVPCVPALHRDRGEEGPPSLEYIQAKDLFPPKELVKEEESLQVPFTVLQGEGVEYLGHANDAVIAISNYRLHIKFKDSVINVPLRMMESVECRDMFQLHIVCKDSKVIRCHFSTFKQCQEWLKRLTRAIARPAKPEDLFAFAYHAWCLGVCVDEEDQHAHLCRPGDHVRYRFEMELVRMGFDLQNVWRVSDINNNYKLCSSYPQKLLVPVWITDKELENVASFRSWKRIPVVVYRHVRNGAVIARCSQPEISWWGWRNADDEYLVTSIAKACALNPGVKVSGGVLHNGSSDGSEACDADFDSSLTACSGVENAGTPQKLLILDARSYTAAVANRAKGGGCECEEYYPNCEVVFMGMANIHSIRNSFQYLRAVCSQVPDPSNWLSALESTKWLQHLSVMLKAAVLVSSAVDREGRPVLVHCSDGWDRTPQIVALAKILLDPYYRTMEGFQVLVESDWLDFGHKFGDRCGHQEKVEDQNEQCPVFLQWLDAVHQLLKQFPCLFEFNEAFLVKLVQHTYSCLYGTFLGNSPCEREMHNIYKRTCSVWSLLRAGNKNFHNLLYMPGSEQVLHPVCHVRALHVWTAVYLPASSPHPLGQDDMDIYLPPGSQSQEFSGRCLDRLPKTRSMDDLLSACFSACDSSSPLTRTSSDPNLNNHCQEVRVGLEARHAAAEGAEPHLGEGGVVAGGETRQEEEREESARSSRAEHGGQSKQLSGWASVPASSAPLGAEKGDGTYTEELDGTCPAPSPSREENVDRVPSSSGKQLETGPQEPLKAADVVSDGGGCLRRNATCQDVPSQESLAPSAPRQVIPGPAPGIRCPDEDNGKGDAGRSVPGEEPGRLGRIPLEQWRKPISQSQSSEFSFLGSNWDSFQGMVTSLPNGEAAPRHLLSYGCCSKRPSSRPLRPAEPPMDYEDDFTCLKESDGSDTEDFCSDHSEDCLSEASWEPVDKKETEVTRWVPDHMASHCFNCDCEFWLAKRRHHCRNCGNVFCAGCCHLKLPIPDQQLYDPVLVCNSCYDHIQVSRARELMSQHLKKPIATASS
ncbi:PREDICTED: LOW QUALITY PROTEIN: myotubularin-related protein 4, partial [Eurypyga helias]|uniref:LOW QUALITY PROTEIN: myotubularin-related protein 4 n=1 Tax=Eurypyga helias TaxID=54383 RepID=UPI00052825EF